MLLSDAYKNLTPPAKTQVREEILLICEARAIKCSRGYLTLILQGQRDQPCSDILARLISGYIRGLVGLDVSPDDVLASVKVQINTHG